MVLPVENIRYILELSTENVTGSNFWYIITVPSKDGNCNGTIDNIEFANVGALHATENFEINEFFHLTKSDSNCFVCDKVIIRGFYSLAETLTSTSRTNITKKIVELLDKSYVIVVGADDYICQNCVKLFNRLDELETELSITKNAIIDKIENTYMDERKKKKIPSHIYKNLKLTFKRKKGDNIHDSSKKFKRETQNVLAEKRINQCSWEEPIANSTTNYICNRQDHHHKRKEKLSLPNVEKTNYVPYHIKEEHDVLTIKTINIDYNNETSLIEQNTKFLQSKKFLF